MAEVNGDLQSPKPSSSEIMNSNLSTHLIHGFPHHSFPSASDFGHQTNKEKGLGGRKRKRNRVESAVEKQNEVIHVRAKRGQATDSHSLAERVRREKINERMRCLQDLVPGCYKTMGMAVMLDVIISYVQSLKNQIEGINEYEVQVMERMGKEGYGGAPSCHSAWPL